MISISYNRDMIKIYRNHEVIWSRYFHDFDELLKTMEQLKNELKQVLN